MLDKMNKLFATFTEIDKAALGFPVAGRKNCYGNNRHISELKSLC